MTGWPSLPYEAWKDTYETLHLWTQVVGKIRLTCAPWLNHCWHVTFYPTACGLTTAAMPHGEQSFQIDFDFVTHELVIRTSRGERRVIPLRPMAVAEFHRDTLEALKDLGVPVAIYRRPCELEQAIPFDEDTVHRSYDAEYAHRCWLIISRSAHIFQRFRSRFRGKASPVHFFWGSFDLAATRFSGRAAPPHPGGFPNMPDRVTRDAYSHEESSCGFWPGGAAAPYPLFYSYAYPEPEGFSSWSVQPAAARYDGALREFVLPYDAMRESEAPEETLLAFLQSSYDAAADLGHWDRRSLEVA
jgi:hypothetical protein